MQLAPGSPTQDNANAAVQFYVDYPGGGTMSQEILLLIINAQLDSIQEKAGFATTIVTTVEQVTVPPPTVENRDNTIDVVLLNFDADQVCIRYFIS